jgi:hypothetical protein
VSANQKGQCRRLRWLAGVSLLATALVSVAEAPQVAAQTGSGGLLTTLIPARAFDSRATTPIGAGATRTLTLAGAYGIPAGASAVALNVTAVSPTANTYLTLWPSGSGRPATSSLNVSAGDTRPNAVIVGLGVGGAIDIYNDSGSANVLVDVTGWFSGGTAAAGGLTPVTPARILDTRSGLGAPVGAVGGGATIDLAVAGVGGVPPSGVAAVVLNLTGTGPTASTYVTVHPQGTGRPEVSTLNLVPGETAANLAIVPLGANSSIRLFNAAGSTHLIADVTGWISSGTPGVGGFVPLSPVRVYDSRTATGLRARGWLPVKASTGGVPASGVAALAANFTAVGANANSYVSIFPTAPGSSSITNVPIANLPQTSTLNVRSGQTIPNASITPVGPEASVWAYNQEGFFDLLMDVSGYWIGTTPAGNAPAVPAQSAAGSSYARQQTEGGLPLFWDTCTPIKLYIETANGGGVGLDGVNAAVERLRRATGLQIQYAGSKVVTNPFTQLDNYEIVVRWRSSTQNTNLTGSTLAVTETFFFDDGEIGAALVTMRTDFPGGLRDNFGPGASWGAVLIHELAHAFGLGHTPGDASQIMFPSITNGIDEFNSGDLAGLAAIRRPGCFLKGDRGPREVLTTVN